MVDVLHGPQEGETRRWALRGLAAAGGLGAVALLFGIPGWRAADPAVLVGSWKEVTRGGWARPGKARFNASGYMRISGVQPPGFDYAPSLSGKWAPDGANALSVSLIESRGGRFRGRIGWRVRDGRLSLSFPGSILNGAIAFFERD